MQNLPSLIIVGLLTFWSLYFWSGLSHTLWHKQHPLPYRPRPVVSWNPFLVALVLLWVGNQLFVRVSGLADQQIPQKLTLRQVQLTCLMNVILLLVVGALMTWSGRHRLSDFGIHLRNWPAQALEGARGFLASWAPVMALLLVMSPLRSPETRHTFFQILEEHPGPVTIAWILLAAVVLAPLAEELIYRVVLQGWLQTYIHPAWAIGLTAVIFSSAHGWRDAVPLLPLSVILGYVYYRTHSFLAVVILHLLFNGTQLTIALLTQLPDKVPPEVAGWLW